MKFSIITPSYNQGPFIERTIRSVLDQTGDFELEYIVVDGGSTDETLDILRRYDGKLRWISEPDKGQGDAINKGFAMASGDVLAWLNSDDTYEMGALASVTSEYSRSPFAWCFGDCRVINENDHEIRPIVTRYKMHESRHYSYHRLLRRDFISQPAVFFSRNAWAEVGPIDAALVYSMDYDYWLRLGRRYTPRYIHQFLANFRWHEASKNGARYRHAAREAYETACHHATGSEQLDILMHYFHYRALSIVYAII